MTETQQNVEKVTLAEAVERDRKRRDEAHTCLTNAGSPVCSACRRDRSHG